MQTKAICELKTFVIVNGKFAFKLGANPSAPVTTTASTTVTTATATNTNSSGAASTPSSPGAHRSWMRHAQPLVRTFGDELPLLPAWKLECLYDMLSVPLPMDYSSNHQKLLALAKSVDNGQFPNRKPIILAALDALEIQTQAPSSKRLKTSD
jgi:hypothetical protein